WCAAIRPFPAENANYPLVPLSAAWAAASLATQDSSPRQETGMLGTAQARNRFRVSRNTLMFGITLLLVFAVIELAAYFTARELSQKGAIYNPSLITQDYAAYLAKRDLDLGWGPPPDSVTSTRNDPLFPASAPPCVSLFGDSFTWASEVADKDAWASVLGGKLKCRVANYGVGGYGSDQALLRFLSVVPESPIVFLNHLSENILRNTNQYRNLLYPGHEFALKPRFINRDGILELVRTPDISPDSVSDFLRHPNKYLKHEFFLPDAGTGIRSFQFPYIMTVLKTIIWNYHIFAILTNTPRHADFYLPEHESDGLNVTFGIMRAFAEAAAKRGQHPIVTLIPTCLDLKYFNRTGEFPYANLKALLAAERIRLIDFGEEIAKRLDGSPPERLFHDCSSHFNERGYGYLADIAFDYLNGDADLRRLYEMKSEGAAFFPVQRELVQAH
ncbi:MAG: hypothetical protein ACOYB4_03515, partial [Methyloceanibacter sp.]